MSALFLKYRPQIFSDLVGQESIVRTLQNALKNGKPSHAYLFFGSRGTGKTSTARIFAKGLLCKNLKEGSPCGQCEFCRDTAAGTLIDVIEIDAASNRGIDEIRDLREKIKFAPNRAARKVYIIDEAHMLTKEAFNALLKTLEEPPEHAFFLLATTEIHKLPETIISRCQTFVFHRFTIPQLTERLKSIAETEKFTVNQESLELIARKAEGGLRDAISLLDQISAEMENRITPENVRSSLGISSEETLEKFWSAITEKDAERAFSFLREISSSGKDFRTFGHDMLGFLRDKMHKSLGSPEHISQILPAIQEMEEALVRIKTSPIMELPFEIAVVHLCQGESVPMPQTVKQETAKPKAEMPKPAPKAEEKKDAGFVFEDKTEHQRVHQAPVKQESGNTPVAISIDTVTAKMKDIADKANIPSFAKQSFLSTKPEFSGTKLIFRSESAWHREKLQSEITRVAIQNAIIDIFQQKIMVEFANGKVDKKQEPEVATAADVLNF